MHNCLKTAREKSEANFAIAHLLLSSPLLRLTYQNAPLSDISPLYVQESLMNAIIFKNLNLSPFHVLKLCFKQNLYIARDFMNEQPLRKFRYTRTFESFAERPHEGAMYPDELGRVDGVRLVQHNPELK